MAVEIETYIHRHAFILSDDPSRVDIGAVASLLSDTDWMGGSTPDQIRTSLENTHLYALFAPDGSLAGCVSVLSDRVFNARLSNLLIVPEHRARGLGRWIMATLLYSSRFKNVQTWQLIADDAQNLYRRFSFELFEGDGEFMTLRRGKHDG
ncbi:MAG: GNAT family N-acetyltransferase [Pseudomonadota bacterium]